MSEGKRKVLTFHYKGRFESGEIFSDSTNGEPLTIVQGQNAVMPELEEALLRLQPGETTEVFAPLAYGPYDESAVQTRIMKYSISNGDKLQEGMEVMWTSPQNPRDPIPAKIIRADEFSFDIDFNHPLAGKDLYYWVQLIDVKEK